MAKISYYEINVNSSAGKLVSVETDKSVITLPLPEHLEEFNFKITIVVYNSEGMSSPSTSRNFGMRSAYTASYVFIDCSYVAVSYL